MTDDQEAPREPRDEAPPWHWRGDSNFTEEERAHLKKSYEQGREFYSPGGESPEERLHKMEELSNAERERLTVVFNRGSHDEFREYKESHDGRLPPNAGERSTNKRLWESECAKITTPPCFIHLPSGILLSDKAFTKKYGHLFGGKPAASTADKSKKIASYDGLTFQPPRDYSAQVLPWTKEVRIGPNGPVALKYYNTYKPNPLKPLRDHKPDVFLSHLRYLVPDADERKMLGDWLADLVQHPGQKRQFAILLIGGEGTGKSWLADLMKCIVGKWNVSTPRNKTLARDFNGWIREKTLAIMHELKGKVDSSENLKDIITQGTCEVNIKGIEAFEIPNHVSLFLISNHDDCIPMDDGSRRYLVIQCAKVPYGALPVSDGKKPYTMTPAYDAYYNRLFSVEEGFPADKSDPPATDEALRVLAFLLDRKILLNCRSVAPYTEAKSKVVEAGRTSLDSLMTSAFRNREPPFNGGVFAPSDVIGDIDPEHNLPGIERTHAKVTAMCRRLGCEPINGDKTVRVPAHGRRTLWAVSLTDATIYRRLEPKQLAKRYSLARKQAGEAAATVEKEADAATPGDAEADIS